MLFSRNQFSRLVLPVGVATAALVFSAGPVAADSPWIPAGMKGFQAQQIHQQATLHEARPAASQIPVTAATSHHATAEDFSHLQVSVTYPATATRSVPSVSAPAVVAIRGPEGELRQFQVEGGREALQNRVIVVHSGEKATIQFVVAPRKGK
ncbi:hypothetical protein [Fimbriiglobus ruber]|uniref:hypothetical protein n=1 Tax=Fimbriiglobus ruber TaxID=1908690 RepID=UPI00117B156E|nr:hypothetical protein [Fimbriiglobus ruber]